ncbi:MAG: alanine--tRNA ligase [Candidatus Berkelbacteria bacterium]|nr:alanine--tRNA ligase [Candidatus Berkelbacteria bacterium]
MKSAEIRKKFLEFFQERGHKIMPSSSLVPENDPSVLFTTAGMQQFKRYYSFPDEISSARIATCQKCLRTGDIYEVGDESHLTFFEMLGNFSFGWTRKNADLTQTNAGKSYFKKEAIEFGWQFLTEELKIDKARISTTYFAGEKEIPADEESAKILEGIAGLDEIKPTGFSETFWSLGTEGSPGGPTVEFYVDGIEVWNLVFNQFVLREGKYQPSEFQGVDTGMGLERLVAVIESKSDIYETDIFLPIISEIEKISDKKYGENKREFRIIADHLRSAVALISDGVVPANKDRGYVLRRLIRRAIVKGRQIGINKNFTADFFEDKNVKTELENEETKFRKTLENGLKIIETQKEFSGKVLFDLYQTYGIPLEIVVEEAKNFGREIGSGEIQESEKLLRQHQELSRTASAGMFKGGLADDKIETTRLHTAAHLLLAALRIVLGADVSQKGSNITEERLRFDFNHQEKMLPEQITEVEKIVNEKISENLPVEMEEMSIVEAKSSGATGVFDDRYGDKVKVYMIGDIENPFSREICGGPHVARTGELGHFKITKEESSSSGIRRIKAILE